MLEWNQFVKPVMYVLEMIFGMVVTFGTADKLIWTSPSEGTRCVLRNSMGSCISVIILGTLALIVMVLVLWRRVISAFDDDVVLFEHDEEAVVLALATFLWVIVSAVFTGQQFWWEPPPQSVTKLRGERYVMLVFSWLLCVMTGFSAAIAWFVPPRDEPVPQASSMPAGVAVPEQFSGPNPSADPGASDCSTLGRSGPDSSNEEAGAHLVRLNAARSQSLLPSRADPDVSAINAKLSAWEDVLAGPREDPHAQALAAAIRLPIPGASSRASSAEPRTAPPLPPRRDGLRRRAVHFPSPGTENESSK